ncbi:MAG: hypothetical protein L0206_18530, partial [Actinobacteria bacterium]|nr:hypothetical protein [Actinomycetota bacterium]
MPGVTGDQLGSASGLGIQCFDVTDDGVQDVVVGAIVADVGGVLNAGAVYVWRGGQSLAGNVQPLATLTANGPVASDFLGSATGRPIQCADVSGDGALDIIAAAPNADVAAVNSGAIYVWRGGSNLSGALQPSARLAVTGAIANDSLGSTSGQAFQCVDVTGDGDLDIVAGAAFADLAVLDAGAVYFWRGGPSLAGNLDATARLTVNGAIASDFLSLGSGLGVQCDDVTGDDVADIVVSATSADRGAVVNAGAIYVWRGSDNLAGTLQPSATLANPAPVAFDNLGNANGQGIQLCDVTGDGISDIVAGAFVADAGAQDTGAIFLWRGSDNLAGNV